MAMAGPVGVGVGRGPRDDGRPVGPGGLAGLPDLGARGGLRLTLGLALLDLGIVGSWLGAEFIQNVLPRLLRGLLAIGKTGFLEAHKRPCRFQYRWWDAG